MLFRRPCYYDDFICKADKCSDNCCIGWEICIDGETAQKYAAVKGDFGKRLRENIDFSQEASFILKGERCPFLNERNLCDIIINMGKDSLCQICRDHPRYFEWYGNVKEGGIGLSCEEAARLILTDGCYADFFESETDEYADEDFDEGAFSLLFSVRERIFDILCDCSLPLEVRFSEILSLTDAAESMMKSRQVQKIMWDFSFSEELKGLVGVLEQTEAIDEKWETLLIKLEKALSEGLELSLSSNEEKYAERLFAYFVWRYFLKSVFDGQLTEKIRFALFSVTAIFALYRSLGEESFEALVKSAVIYSKQMEYSDKNLDFYYDSLYN
ncbi:MAG: hypothetical protein E7406_03585 [Ruminococcaceae bacterium]|nr:hypothetical protein [Oscillospiraceae bacterium]